MRNMRIFYVRFVKELLRGNYDRKEIRAFCRDLKPFFDYLEAATHVKSIRGIRKFHVRDYALGIQRSCTPRSPFMNVLEANDKLVALRMFCLKLHVAGVYSEDYSAGIGSIAYPEPPRKTGSSWKS